MIHNGLEGNIKSFVGTSQRRSYVGVDILITIRTRNAPPLLSQEEEKADKNTAQRAHEFECFIRARSGNKMV